MDSLNIQHFKNLNKKDDFLLVDVREEYEFEDSNIGGMNIPLAEVLNNLDLFKAYGTVVFVCKSGKRSEAIAQSVERKTGHLGICTLKGGLDAYFDPEIMA